MPLELRKKNKTVITWLPGYIEGHWPLVDFQGTRDFPRRPGAANLNWEISPALILC